jgi:hypothetical protein
MTRLMITLAVATVLTQMAEAQGEDVKAAADRFDQAQQAGTAPRWNGCWPTTWCSCG